MSGVSRMKNQMWDQLDRAFTVCNIMTPRDRWITIHLKGNNDLNEAQLKNLEFDITPIERDDVIETFVQKDLPNQEQDISQEWLISSDTTIPNLLNIFIECNKKALFVLKNQDVIGLVSPADFNKIESRVYIYLLIGQLEIALSDFIFEKGNLNRDEILSSLSARRKDDILIKEEQLLISNLDSNILELLYLSDLLTLIQKNKQLYEQLNFPSRKQTEKAMSGINDLRNDTMHLNNPLIYRKEDGMEILAKRIRRIQDLMGRI